MPRRASATSTLSPRRLWIVQLALTAWALAILARLFTLQVVDYGWLKQKASHQQTRAETVPAQRGEIVDRNLKAMAITVPAVSIAADPKLIHDPDAVAARLAPILQEDAAAVAARLRKSGSFVWIERQASEDQAAAIKALHVAGVELQDDTRREYPNQDLAANLLGYVGVDGTGLGGVEAAFDSSIHGQDGLAVAEVDAHRQAYAQLDRGTRAGENLVLTIDENIQFIAQQALDKRVAETHAARGIAVVQNPATGEILALAQSPRFDPNDYKASPAANWTDAAVSDVYEPGSVMKLVTLSAALEEGKATPDEIVDCSPGWIKVGGRIIHDHQTFGDLTVTQILQHSSDVGAIKLGMRLGDQKMYDYIRAYGFGQTTGMKLPGESRGIVRPVRAWTPMSIGAVSIGQEVAVTPVQTIGLISTIADGGIYHAPRIILGEYSGPAPAQPPAFVSSGERRVITPVVANEMKAMMAQVVLAGTATQAQLNGYTAAGKTGTAQKADPGTRGYSTTDFVSSFGGFAPVNDPALSILVVIDSPRGGHEGGPTAGPVFKAIAEQALPYLGVPHDTPAKTAPALHTAALDPVLRAADLNEDSEPLSTPAELLPADAPAVVTTAFPAAAAPTPPANVSGGPSTASPRGPLSVPAANPSRVVVMNYDPTGGKTIPAPDFRGKSLRAVSDICQQLGLEPVLQGNGVARGQDPAPGTPLRMGGKIVVQFQP